MDITYILTTTGAAKLKRYYEHIFGVTAIFRASTQKLFLVLFQAVIYVLSFKKMLA